VRQHLAWSGRLNQIYALERQLDSVTRHLNCMLPASSMAPTAALEPIRREK
jgi:hypothetical protein